MAEHDVAEFLTGWSWNPFPTVRFTERPDVAAFHLLEGHALVLVDTTPQVIIAPATLWNHLQHPEDFHLSPAMGTFMRWTQYAGLLAATLLPPLWLAFVLDPRLVHALPGLAFIGPKKPSGFPIGLQLIGAEFTLDILRRAILNTPDSLAQTMGIVGAIVLGDVAAKAGVFSSEALVYIVLAAIGQFAISSIELGAATRLVRFSLLVATWGFRFPGLLVGVALWLIVLLQTRTFGIPYTWPLIPFDWVAFRTMLYRPPVMVRPPRPAALRTQNRSRE
jgi:stage V sporulation protein AF